MAGGNTKYILIFATFGLISSCLNRQFVEGRAEIVSVSDTTLNDSSFIFGHIYRVDWVGNYSYQVNEFEIWIENSILRTTTDITGFYSIKTIPGTYSIKCQETFNEWGKLIVEIKDFEMGKNKKTHIDFYIGYTLE